MSEFAPLDADDAGGDGRPAVRMRRTVGQPPSARWAAVSQLLHVRAPRNVQLQETAGIEPGILMFLCTVKTHGIPRHYKQR